MSIHQSSGRHKIHYFLIWTVFVIITFIGCLAGGYWLAVHVLDVSGFSAHLISGLAGLFLFSGGMILFKLYAELHVRRHLHRRHGWAFDHSAFLQSTMDAINRISQGDFNVLIPVEEHDPFSEVAESVNKMARELSSMENLRQDFISNVSHEIQSPLTSISGFAALLRNEALSKEEREHYLDVIETESKRLSKLSDSLLKLSALESGAVPLKAVEFKLDKQIEHAVLMLEPQWAAKQLILSLSIDKIMFTGDEEFLTQVWVNLLHNAIKFTPNEGHIEISLNADEQKLYAKIADSGIGIAKEDQIHLFERFYKVDKSRDRSLGGNGLGLSLVKKIVDMHGGQIDITSALGEGTVFTVTLPRFTKST